MRAHARSRRQLLHGGLAMTCLGLLAGCGLLPGSPSRGPRVRRLGWLSIGRVDGGPDVSLEAFRQGLSELGYVDGQNVIIDAHFADSRDLANQFPAHAREIVSREPEVVVAGDLPAGGALKAASDQIPIVLVAPVAPSTTAEDSRGLAPLVGSLARPGSNVTGLIGTVEGLWSKRLELLRDCIPGARRIGALWNTHNVGPFSRFESGFVDGGPPIGPALGIELIPLEVSTLDDVEQAIEAGRNAGVDGLAYFTTVYIAPDVRRVAGLALGKHLPSVADNRGYVPAGGLMAYAADTLAMYRRAATYVDKILRGLTPEQLPVEQPTRFDLLINLNTARGLGLTIPPHILAQASAVIQ